MPANSSYGTYLPSILWSPPPPAGTFGILAMLAPFEKILTGIKDGIPITHGDGSLLTTVTQAVIGNPSPQSVEIVAGTGSKFVAGSSYTYDQRLPEVITVTAATANTITAIIRQNHSANQTITNNSGVHSDIQSVIADLVQLYGAWTTPSDYLDWLAQWVALQLQPSWDEYQKRTTISMMANLYAKRGTKQGLDQFFEVYAISPPPVPPVRLVVDNASTVLFLKPKAGTIVPLSTLVSQKPLVAPVCAAMDRSGYIFVGDVGPGDSTIKPAIWRISPSGDYDYAAGLPQQPQPYQPSVLSLTTPVAVAVDNVNGGAYVIDSTGGTLYRLTAPQTGTITLSGTPVAGGTATVTIAGTTYTLNQTSGSTAPQQAAAWATILMAAPTFSSKYSASSSSTAPVITITPLAGEPANDLQNVTYSAGGVTLVATGPAFGTYSSFATGIVTFPQGMFVSAAGHPLILDRGATPGNPSVTAIVDVQISSGSSPTFTTTVRHAFPGIEEPLSMCLRADGSLIVADAALQTSTNPADLIAINTGSWTATSLLGTVPADQNPLIAPTGIVEIDAEHLLVLDAGLRPFVPSAATPFTPLIAQQAGVYLVDLSATPPVISLAGELKSLVYPRAMIGDGKGTFYICDSGLPDAGSREWRSSPHQCAVVAHFQGDPTLPIFQVTITGAPTTGHQCSISIGGTVVTLPEVTGNTTTVQATAWSNALNNNSSFGSLYVTATAANVLSIYPAAGTVSKSAAFSTTSSATVTLTVNTSLSTTPIFLGTVALSGFPTTGESCQVVLGSLSPLTLPETTGFSLAEQAQAWCTGNLNGYPTDYQANNTGGTINVFALSAAEASTLSARSSAHLALSVYSGIQNRRQFLQSVSDVVADQIPAHTGWRLQSQ
jgi:phage tail-like protein